MAFCEFFFNKLIAKYIHTLAPGAHGGQGAHLRHSDPGLSARTGSLVVVVTWSGGYCSPLGWQDRAGDMVRPPVLRSVRSQLRYCRRTWVQLPGR